jgi:hypothetical protein
MAATVVLVNPTEWPVIRRFLADCKERAVVIPPEARSRVERRWPNANFLKLKGKTIDYDFGGRPDIMLDVATNLAAEPHEHFGTECLLKALGIGESDSDVELDEPDDSRGDLRITDDPIGLLQELNATVYQNTECFDEANIGADLAYLFGAVVNDNHCEWADNRPL